MTTGPWTAVAVRFDPAWPIKFSFIDSGLGIAVAVPLTAWPINFSFSRVIQTMVAVRFTALTYNIYIL